MGIIAQVSLLFDAPLSFDALRKSWRETVAARPMFVATVRRSKSAPSGLEYVMPTPAGLEKYYERQAAAPDKLKDFYCREESHRSFSDVCPGLDVGPDAPCRSGRIFVADPEDPKDAEVTFTYNGVRTFDELLDKNRPVVIIQVTRFRDATAITFSISHVFGDLFALKSLLKSWEAALSGQKLEPFDGLEKDPFVEYLPGGKYARGAEDAAAPSPLPPPGWRIFGLTDKVRFLYNVLWDCYVSRPERNIKKKYLFLPEANVKALEAQAKVDLALYHDRQLLDNPDKTSAKIPWVSRADVLMAWIMKLNHAHLPRSRYATSLAIANARAKPPTGLKASSDDFPAHNIYNAGMTVPLPRLQVGQILDMPIGELALHVRRGLGEGLTPENVRRYLSFTLHHSQWRGPSGEMPFFAAPTDAFSGMSDWRLIKLQDLDFAPARLDKSKSGPVVPATITGSMVTGNTQRGCWVCFGESYGGVWFLGITGEDQWNDQRGLGKFERITPTPRSKL